MKKVMAFVFAGVRTQGLSVLTHSRSVAAVPFGGKYRLIDFTLSNCVNSELTTVAILAQHAPHSLIKHVGRGKPWDLDRRGGGVQILQPYERQEGRRWYQGTADALRQNLDVLENSGADHVFVLSSELAYKMDYSWMFSHHLETGARATLAIAPLRGSSGSHFGAVRADEAGRILSYDPQGGETPPHEAFMGVYLFDTPFLRELLSDPDPSNLFLDCLLPRMTDGREILAYHFGGEWLGLASIRDYLGANRGLLAAPPILDLYDPEWTIYARSEEMAPAWVSPGARVTDTLLSNGSVIEGRVERSILSPGVFVEPGAVVRDSVILNHTRIGADAVVERSVLDKRVCVGRGARVGNLTESGITAVGKRAVIADGSVVAAGVEVPHREIMDDDPLTLTSERSFG